MLLAVAEAQRIQSDLIPKIATGFCSGLARTADLCGAVTGAMLAINMLTGRNDPSQSVDENYRLVQQLINRFEGKFGSINCQVLTGCDLGTDAGQQRFRDENIRLQCQHYVESATRMTLEVLG